MSGKVTIRPYVGSDLESVIAILRDLFSSELKLYDRTRAPHEIGADYVANLQEEAEKSKGVMLVAETDGAVVGYCTLHTHRDTLGDTDEIFYTYAHIGDVSVLERYRNLGIGTLLIERCEEIARAAGIKWLRLNVLAANTGGRKFYAARGFEDNQINLEKAL